MGVKTLGVAVIERALIDAKQPPFLGRKKQLHRGKMRNLLVVNTVCEQAIEFLSRESEDLSFWCDVADLRMTELVRVSAPMFRDRRDVIATARRDNAVALEE